MAVHHISHRAPGESFHTIPVSTIFLSMHNASQSDPEMVIFLTVSRAGKYGIENGPEHCMNSSSWDLYRKINSSNPNIMHMHWRFQEAASICSGSNYD